MGGQPEVVAEQDDLPGGLGPTCAERLIDAVSDEEVAIVKAGIPEAQESLRDWADGVTDVGGAERQDIGIRGEVVEEMLDAANLSNKDGV